MYDWIDDENFFSQPKPEISVRQSVSGSQSYGVDAFDLVFSRNVKELNDSDFNAVMLASMIFINKSLDRRIAQKLVRGLCVSDEATITVEWKGRSDIIAARAYLDGFMQVERNLSEVHVAEVKDFLRDFVKLMKDRDEKFFKNSEFIDRLVAGL